MLNKVYDIKCLDYQSEAIKKAVSHFLEHRKTQYVIDTPAPNQLEKHDKQIKKLMKKLEKTKEYIQKFLALAVNEAIPKGKISSEKGA